MLTAKRNLGLAMRHHVGRHSSCSEFSNRYASAAASMIRRGCAVSETGAMRGDEKKSVALVLRLRSGLG